MNTENQLTPEDEAKLGLIDDPLFSRKKKLEFLEALTVNGLNIKQTCKDIGIGIASVYRARARDPQFCMLWEHARPIGRALLESEAYRRAIDGVDEDIFQKGLRVGSVRKYSDSLLIFLLKNNWKEKYGDPNALKNSKTPQVEEDLSGLSDEEFRELMILLGKARKIAAERKKLEQTVDMEQGPQDVFRQSPPPTPE